MSESLILDKGRKRRRFDLGFSLGQKSPDSFLQLIGAERLCQRISLSLDSLKIYRRNRIGEEKNGKRELIRESDKTWDIRARFRRKTKDEEVNVFFKLSRWIF